MREGLLAQGSAGSLSDNTGHLANPPSRQVAYLQSWSSTQIDAQYNILFSERGEEVAKDEEDASEKLVLPAI